MKEMRIARFLAAACVAAAMGALVVEDLAGQRGGERSAGTLSLREAVRIAIDRNRRLEEARFDLEAADQTVRDAWGQFYPTLTLTANYTRNVSPSVTFVPAQFFDPGAPEGEFISLQFGADNSWRSSLRAEQSLFRPQLLVGVGAAARYQALRAEEIRGRTQNVVTTVRIAYYDLLLAQEEVRLTSNSLERVEASLREARARREAGFASEYDVVRLQVERANLGSDLRRARDAVASRRRALAVNLDVDADGLAVQGSLAELDLDDLESNSRQNRELLAFTGIGSSVEMDREDLLARARGERSDVKQLELTERLRGTELRLEQLEYFPEVSLFGEYDIQAQQNGRPAFFGNSLQRAHAKNVGISVRLPLFNGFRREATIDQKRAELRKARNQTEYTRRQVTHQIEDLLDELEETRLRADAQRLAVEQALLGYGIARAEHREGTGSRLQLTDAEVALRRSEFNYARAVYDHLAARARLDEAVGRVPLVDILLDR